MKRGGGGTDKEEDNFESSDLVLCRECIRKAPQHFLLWCTHAYTLCGWQAPPPPLAASDLYRLTALSNSIYDACARMHALLKSLPELSFPPPFKLMFAKQEWVLIRRRFHSWRRLTVLTAHTSFNYHVSQMHLNIIYTKGSHLLHSALKKKSLFSPRPVYNDTTVRNINMLN